MEWHCYLVSPLIMWAAWNTRRGAPRRFGLALLAAGSLVQPLLLGLTMPIWGYTDATISYVGANTRLYTLPILRCAPYFSGMFVAVAVTMAKRRAQLPTTRVTAAATAAAAPAPALPESSASSAASLCKGSDSDFVVVALGAGAGAPAKEAAPQATLQRVISLTATAGLAPLRSPSTGGSCSGSAARARWLRHLLTALDLSALLVWLGLAFCGVGMNRQALVHGTPGWEHCMNWRRFPCALHQATASLACLPHGC